MATGDIVNFGLIKLTYVDNKGTAIQGKTDYFKTINYRIYSDYIQYENIEIIEGLNNTSESKLDWIEYQSDNKKMFIPVNIGINRITYKEALEICNKIFTINGVKYSYTLLSLSQWTGLPQNILSKFKFDSDLEIWTNSTVTIGNTSGFASVKRQTLDDGSFILNNSTYGMDNEKESLYFIPILVQLNSPPIISGNDTDLGNKTSSFSVTYSVSDEDSGQELTVTEKLNGNVIRTLQNPTQGLTLTYSITDEIFASLSMNTTNTIEIEVTDGSATTYRRYTFVKTNSAPLINYSGQANLGQLTSKPRITYSVRDNEGDIITVTEKLNGEVIKQFTATSNTNYTITLTDEFWLTCGKNTNTIEISASDVNGGTSYKHITFTRKVNKVQITTKNPIETNAAATKIMVSPDWSETGCTGKVEVCNNGFDASPTWEDMTTLAKLNRPYVFTNKTKTASKWGIKIRLTLTKNSGYTGEVAIYGFGGAFE